MSRIHAILFIAVTIFGSVNRCQAEDRPNLVFLMADDQCVRSLGCYGTPGVKTPNIDQLATDGLVFDRHYDSTAICMASRANVMTGLYEHRNGCNFDHGPMMQETWSKSYPVLLREAGYLTAFAGKFGFEVKVGDAKPAMPISDFDSWGGSPGQTSYVTAQNASMKKYAKEYPHSTRSYGAFGRDFINEASKQDKPFCLSISFKAPHHPVQPDPKFDAVYRDVIFPKPKNYGRENGEHFSKQSQQGRQYARFFDWNYASDYNGVMSLYHQQVYAIDVAVGMIREALKESDVAENTVVIYTSDNGFLCGSHGYGSKVLPYEEASNVPLIIFDPRHQNSGKKLRCASLTGNIDFAPTLLALAGIEPPAGIDGRNLMPLYDDPESSIRETLLLINVWGPKAAHSLSVLTQNWKYIYWPYAENDFVATEELYNITEDPLEMSNRAKSSGDKKSLNDLRKIYDAEVEGWKKNAVPYNDYKRHGVLFDRQLDWKTKQQLIETKTKRHRVEGEISVDGEPLEKGIIRFVPLNGFGRESAQPIKSGAYEFNGAKGLAIGEYKVEIRTSTKSEKKRPEIKNAAEILPQKYNAESIIKATVNEGENKLNIDLKTK